MSLATALLLLGTGIVAGFINTVAGGGSVITLPVLVALMGASVANGTNRVAILLQNVAGVAGFSRAGKVPWRQVLPLVPSLLAGAALGAFVATLLPAAAMKRVFGLVVLLVAASVLVKPSRWLGGGGARIREPWRSAAFLGIGFYGGFVQAGVGFLLLAGLVLGGGLDLVRGNAAKVFLVLLYTPIALLLFAGHDQVRLLPGLVLGAGNATGAVIATVLAVRKGAGWIRWVLVLSAVVAALSMFLG
jgi:hypothetical protein